MRILAGLVCAHLFLATLAHAHGEPPPRAADAPGGFVTTAYEGSAAFAETLGRGGAIAFDAQATAELEKALRHFQFSRELAGEGGDEADAAFNRAMGEMLLLEFLEKQEATLLDFRGGGPPPPDNAIAARGRQAAVLLKVQLGDGDPAFAIKSENLGSFPEGLRSVPIDVPDAGVVWVLVTLDDVPRGESYVHLAFRVGDAAEPAHYTSVKIASGPTGRLQVLLRDGDGVETPALVRIRNVGTEALIAPSNAIDLRPQWEDISGVELNGPGGAYPWYEGFGVTGWYWLVPEDFEIELPIGRYEIAAEHGPEHHPARMTVEVVDGQTTEAQIAFEQWIDMGARGWWSGDDHVHARLESDADADRLMALAQATDLNVANILEMGSGMRTWYSQRGFGPDYRVVSGDHALVPGQEDPRYRMGHAIGLNLTSMVRDLDRYMLNDWVADEIHKQGGLYGHTHVGWEMFNIERDMTLLIPRGKSDFNSILQGRLGTRLYYDFLDLGYRLTASAGSDAPYGAVGGAFRLYAYTGNDFDVDEWFEALEAGRTFVTFGPMVDFTIEGALLGEALHYSEDRSLAVRIVAEGEPGGSAPASVRLVHFGEVIAEASSDDAAAGSVTLEHDVQVGDGGWYAAHVVAHDGSEAHTTPIYVVRDGLRPWNHERVPELLENRAASLDEIDAMLADLEDRWNAGDIWRHDYWSRWAVEQAPLVRERTQLVRGLYAELAQQWEREKAIRAR